VRLYVHEPKPPYTLIAGPIRAASIDRRYGLSEDSSADIGVAVGDMQIAWMRPGMCWRIDESTIGEPPWAGFVAAQDIPLAPEEVSLSLTGPKRALLSIELAVRFPGRVSPSYAIEQALIAAHTKHGGIFPGDIDPTQGTATEIDVRGETISDFIDTMREEAPGYEYRERCIVEDDGERLRFLLDFGPLQRPTNIVLHRNDLANGLYHRERITSGVTVLGSAIGFEGRESATTSAEGSTSASEPAAGAFSPLSAVASDLMNERAIGPAAQRHEIFISERVENDVLQVAELRHEELLRNVDEVFLQLDATKASVRRLQLGDIVRLEVPSWGSPLGFPVSVNIHVRHITPQSSLSRRDIVGAVLFS